MNTKEKLERRLVHIPIGRFGECVEVAKAVLFRATCFGLLCLEKEANYCFPVATDDSSFVVVRALSLIFQHICFVDPYLSQGANLMCDGGISAAYITPLGEPKLPPPKSLAI